MMRITVKKCDACGAIDRGNGSDGSWWALVESDGVHVVGPTAKVEAFVALNGLDNRVEVQDLCGRECANKTVFSQGQAVTREAINSAIRAPERASAQPAA